MGKWMILGTLALALAGFYGVKVKQAQVDGEVCREKVTSPNENMIKTGLPILEAVTRHLIRM
jgi:hypothetical protein